MNTKQNRFGFLAFLLFSILFTSCGPSSYETRMKKEEESLTALESSFDTYKSKYLAMKDYKLPIIFQKQPTTKQVATSDSLFMDLLTYSISKSEDSTQIKNAIEAGREIIDLYPEDVFYKSLPDFYKSNFAIMDNYMMKVIDDRISSGTWSKANFRLRKASEVLAYLKKIASAKYIAFDEVEVQLRPQVNSTGFENGISFGKLSLVNIETGDLVYDKSIISMSDREEISAENATGARMLLESEAKAIYKQEINRLLYKESFVYRVDEPAVVE
ncbi:hypothetical protein N9B82_02095 [Saprospiraceae bacterium]|nr:hypothetical protein [Saprospiraceae bacterium]